jgi:hypothetical protein
MGICHRHLFGPYIQDVYIRFSYATTAIIMLKMVCQRRRERKWGRMKQERNENVGGGGGRRQRIIERQKVRELKGGRGK